MNDKDLADVLIALTHISEAIDELGKKLPDARTARLLKSQVGLSAAIISIVKRHAPKPVEFSERDDGCMEFITDLPLVFDDTDGKKNPSVSLTNPCPPPPPRPPSAK